MTNFPDLSRMLLSCIALLLLLTEFIVDGSGYWHAYDSMKATTGNESCSAYEWPANELPKLISKYHLWPNISDLSHYSSEGSKFHQNHTVYGMKYALEHIFKHQHPHNCKTKKFLINGIHRGGFGSEIHILTAVLGLAIEWDRVFVSSVISGNQWQYDNDFCNHISKKKSWECYYRAFSSCDITDALGHNYRQILDLSTMGISQQPKDIVVLKGYPEGFTTNHQVRVEFYESIKNARAIIIKTPGWLPNGVVPHQFQPLLDCSPVKPPFHYYWWRAIGTMYIMRPNEATLEWIREHQIAELEKQEHSNYISLFVRRGDKASEMRIAPLEEYIDAVRLIQSKYSHFTSISTTKPEQSNVIFINSEDDRPIKDLREWNKKKQQNKYSIYTIENLYNRSDLSSAKSVEEKRNERIAVHHPLEYISMIMSINYLVKGNAYVCTLGSNFCRLVDELRATVGGKADHPYVDLSVESCAQVPCVYENVTSFNWRRN